MKKIILAVILLITLLYGCNKNEAPICEFVSPQHGMEIESNLPIAVVISAVDADGKIVDVKFYIDNKLNKTFTSLPYSMMIEANSLSEGMHDLKAIATDDDGAQTETRISIIIKKSEGPIIPGDNISPTCQFVSPINGNEYSVDSEIEVEIEASDEDGVIMQVKFYIDDELDNTMILAPYKCKIAAGKLTEGTHTLKAVAIDDVGAETETSVMIKTVEDTESPDFVTFKDGYIPASWKIQGWQIDNTLGYDDLYSIKTSEVGSVVATTKTFETEGYIEFYSSGSGFKFYIDGNQISMTGVDLGTWARYGTTVPPGTHQFRWESAGYFFNTTYLDAITFGYPELPEVEITYVSIRLYSDNYAVGKINNNTYNEAESVGFCWSESPNPTLDDNVVIGKFDNYSYEPYKFSADMNNIYSSFVPGVNYYFRAYAKNSEGIGFSEDYIAIREFEIGAYYQGGIVAYLDESGKHGLIIAENDINAAIKWNNDSNIITNATSNDGNENTNKIIAAQGNGNYAAKICADAEINGYSDWYLPSKYEFDLIMQVYTSNYFGEFFNFYNGEVYWTSTEESVNNAISCEVSYNYSNVEFSPNNKSTSRRVRAIKAF